MLMIAVVATVLAAGAAQALISTKLGFLDSASLTVLGVRTGGSETLSDVVSRLGPAEIWKTGDAAESTSQVCYRVSGAELSPVILFGSNNEMSVPKGQVNHIVLYGDPREFRNRKRCGTLNRPIDDIGTPNGLKLGMTPSDARSILGAGQLRQGSLEYSASQRRYLEPTDPRYAHWATQTQCFPDSSRPYFDDFAHIMIKFKAGRAIRVSFSSNQGWC
jgi:hypothetical protein